MDVFNAIINAGLRACFAVAWAPPVLAVLTVISAAAGIGMLWVFKKTSNPTKIRAAKRLVYRIFFDGR